MSEPKYVSGADALASWREDLLSGKPPVLYRVGPPAFDSIQVGPGLVTLVGGAPGAGKTALVMQFVFDALRLSESLRVAVCNVEMPPGELLNRQLARLSGVELSAIRHRKLSTEDAEKTDAALAVLEPLCERICFVRAPFDLANIARTADDFGANMIVLDYLQRISPPGELKDNRGSVNALLDFLRRFAGVGVAVLAASSVGRTKDARGRSSYDSSGLGLASFKESGELEYGADSGFILCPSGAGDAVTLRCLKDRNGEPRDIPLRFHRAQQRFHAAESPETKTTKRKLEKALADLWEKTEPAANEETQE